MLVSGEAKRPPPSSPHVPSSPSPSSSPCRASQPPTPITTRSMYNFRARAFLEYNIMLAPKFSLVLVWCVPRTLMRGFDFCRFK
jgi:hypothetical protein